MIRNLSRSLSVMVLILFAISIQAQVYSGVNQSDITRELKKRNISETELRQRAKASNLNIDSVTYFTPLQIKALESIIVELEQEKESQYLDTLPVTDLPITSLDSLSENTERVTKDSLDDLPPPRRYGQSIFRDRVIQFYQDVKGVKAPAGYLLGPGDEVAISIFGKSYLDEKYNVSSDGYLKVNNGSSKVFVKGLTLEAAEEKLKSLYRQYYNFKEGQFNVALSYSRTVQVNVYGEVYKPGPVTASALNDAFAILASSDGPTDIGTLRKIQLIGADGRKEEMDIYKYLSNPQSKDKYFLQDGDVILVPPAENIVSISGAVRRPTEYEMLPNESMSDLLSFAGGFNGDANQEYIKVKRYDNGILKIVDVNYKTESDRFRLMNGDSIFVDRVDSLLQDFVEIEGAVFQKGRFEYERGMRISDLLEKAKIKDEARTDIAFLQRVNQDSTYSYEELDLEMILKDKDARDNIFLQSKDKLTIWYLKNFSDQSIVKVSGAVRKENTVGYDVSNNVKLREAILLSGGLRRDASDLAIIHRKDPLNPKVKRYLTITNLQDIVYGQNQNINVSLSPFDSIYVYSEQEFLDEANVSIEGAVNYPGDYQFGVDMTLKDLLVLAGGVRMNAALNRVEVSRVIIEDNKPTKINIANVSIDQDFNIIGGNPSYQLKPFDVVTVRYVPDFELQKRVEIKGEVIFPGRYTIINDNERLSNLIDRSGGLSPEAFPSGATLTRVEDNLGAVVIKLDEVVENENSEFNFILKDGDVVFIPKQKEFVTIEGATKAETVLSDDAVNFNNRIHVPFTKGKRALYYINEYAGGLSEEADRNGIFVEYPNGEVKRSSNLLFFTSTPKVRKGSTIKVREKEADQEDDANKEDVDWGQVLSDTVAQAVSILTLVLLVQGLE